MAGAFQESFCQGNAFQVARDFTSTINLQLPVDCVLAGAVPIIDSYRTWDIPKAMRTERGSGRRTRAQRLGGSKLSGPAVRNAFNE